MKTYLIFLLSLICFGLSAQNNMTNPMDSTDYSQRNVLTHPGYNNGVYYFIDENGNVQLAAPRLFPTVAEMRSNWIPMPGIMYTLHERGKEGPFRLSMRDSTSADDGMNVIITGYGQRMKRVGNVFSVAPLNRANHTGTQPASTISDFTAAARASISATGSLTYNAATGVINYVTPIMSAVAATGNYEDLTGKPDLSIYYLASNPSGYITSSGLTWNNITGKPDLSQYYLNTNPAGYISATNFTWANLGGKPDLSQYYLASNPAGYLTNAGLTWGAVSGKPISFPTTWTDVSGRPDMGLYYLASNPNGYITASNVTWAAIPDKPMIPAAQVQSDWNQTTTTAPSFIKNKPLINTPTSSNVTRSLNTSFQVSTTRGAFVSYAVKITATITLVVGQTTTVFLETSQDGVNWVSMQNNEFGVNAGIALTMSNTVGVGTFVPAGYYVRIRTSGTAAAVYSSGNETLL